MYSRTWPLHNSLDVSAADMFLASRNAISNDFAASLVPSAPTSHLAYGAGATREELLLRRIQQERIEEDIYQLRKGEERIKKLEEQQMQALARHELESLCGRQGPASMSAPIRLSEPQMPTQNDAVIEIQDDSDDEKVRKPFDNRKRPSMITTSSESMKRPKISDTSVQQSDMLSFYPKELVETFRKSEKARMQDTLQSIIFIATGFRPETAPVNMPYPPLEMHLSITQAHTFAQQMARKEIEELSHVVDVTIGQCSKTIELRDKRQTIQRQKDDTMVDALENEIVMLRKENKLMKEKLEQDDINELKKEIVNLKNENKSLTQRVKQVDMILKNPKSQVEEETNAILKAENKRIYNTLKRKRKLEDNHARAIRDMRLVNAKAFQYLRESINFSSDDDRKDVQK